MTFFSSVSCLFVPVVLMRSLVVILILLWNFCFSFWAINYCMSRCGFLITHPTWCVRFWICLLIVSLNLGTLCHWLFRYVFLYLFSYWSVFKSTDSFLCHLKSTVKTSIVNFSFLLFYFLIPEFLFAPFKNNSS